MSMSQMLFNAAVFLVSDNMCLLRERLNSLFVLFFLFVYFADCFSTFAAKGES